MTTILGRAVLAGAALLALQACGETQTDAPIAPTTTTPEPEPDLTTPSPISETAPSPQSCEATSYCSGPLVVSADNLTLTRFRKNEIEVVGTLSFNNRSGADLKLALLQGQLTLNTDKGVTADQGNIYTSGLGVCRTEGSACFDAEPDTFRLIAPGDSPARLNVKLQGRFEPALAPLVAQIETGTLTVEAYTVAADGSRQVHRIALANTPITNLVTQ
ncbi:hypothetical protein [Erythrobacter donghaensis]|uniref:hypothetical protein n=1 Tax=Erythrobacter donghaensis TaxID=267135 RepID=UPI00117FB64E|nr:hypothetical protein [Erythrobacter donghaensis]